MRYVVAALMVAALAGVYGTSVSTSADAGLVETFSSTSTDTINAGAAFGYLDVGASGGNVGLKVFGYRFESGDDSLVIESGQRMKIDLYKAGTRATSFAVYPASGATASGIYF